MPDELALFSSFFVVPFSRLNQNQNIFTGDTSTDIHSPGPTIAKTSL